ncbi:MAG: flavodoxin family protein [Lachnospiraceae bacterium]|nr:flavodoxin family protein [Lachnospiraceae bacterium]
MKAIIIYASTHHGNTRKVVEAIENKCEIEVIDATKIHEKDLKGYDLIGFASGIFYTRFHEQVLNFARVNLPAGKDVFFIATAGNPIEMNFRSIADVAKDKSCNEVGRFQCKGFDTYGPFKLIGGIQKGHPDDEELKAAVDFYRGIRGQVE